MFVSQTLTHAQSLFERAPSSRAEYNGPDRDDVELSFSPLDWDNRENEFGRKMNTFSLIFMFGEGESP